MFSILILTKNEEANLPSCLESVQWARAVAVKDVKAGTIVAGNPAVKVGVR